MLQVLLGRDVFVDRVEDLRRDPLRPLAVDISIGQRVG
jgi:hypothetical protein